MPEWQARHDRDADHSAELFNHCRKIVSVIRFAQAEFIKIAEHKRLLARECASKMQFIQHTFNPVWMLADIFGKQDSAVDFRQIRRASERRENGEIAPPYGSADVNRLRLWSIATHRNMRVVKRALEMAQRQCVRTFSAEIAAYHWPGESDQ